jgi:hypothetical protein
MPRKKNIITITGLNMVAFYCLLFASDAFRLSQLQLLSLVQCQFHPAELE